MNQRENWQKIKKSWDNTKYTMGDPNDDFSVKDHTNNIVDNGNKNAKDCLEIMAL